MSNKVTNNEGWKGTIYPNSSYLPLSGSQPMGWQNNNHSQLLCLTFFICAFIVFGFFSISSKMESSSSMQYIQEIQIKLGQQALLIEHKMESSSSMQYIQEIQMKMGQQALLIEQGNDKLSLLNNELQGYSQLRIDFYVLKSELNGLKNLAEKSTLTSNGATTAPISSNLSIDQIEGKIALAISELKLEISKQKLEYMNELNQIKQNIGLLDAFPAQKIEFSDLKTQFALLKQEFQRLQTDLQPIILQITPLATMNIEISNIKKNIQDLQTSLNEIKLATSSLINAGQTSTASTSQTSGSNGSTTTEPSSPTSTSSQTSTDNSLYQTEIYGPFESPNWIQKFTVNNGKFSVFSTNKPCIITVKKRAVVTVIATGLGICNGCHAQATFMKGGENHLNLTNCDEEFYSGALNIYTAWVPITLVQEFIVEAGTHEFALWLANIGKGQVLIELEALSFVAKVVY